MGARSESYPVPCKPGARHQSKEDGMKHGFRRRVLSLLASTFAALVLSTAIIHAAPPSSASWKVVKSPHVGKNGSILRGVAALSAQDVWAVGERDTRDAFPKELIEHWDGAAWSVVASPSPEQYQDLEGVASIT